MNATSSLVSTAPYIISFITIYYLILRQATILVAKFNEQKF